MKKEEIFINDGEYHSNTESTKFVSHINPENNEYNGKKGKTFPICLIFSGTSFHFLCFIHFYTFFVIAAIQYWASDYILTVLQITNEPYYQSFIRWTCNKKNRWI